MIGLDLRFPMLRWCSFQRRRQQTYELKTFGEQAVETEAQMTVSVARLLSAIASKRSKIAIALPESAVFMRSVELPTGMSRMEQLEEVKRLARPYVSYESHLLTFDVVEEENKAENPDRVNVLWVATLTEWVEQRIELLSSWGNQVCIVDVETLALRRASAMGAPFPPGDPSDWALSVGLALRLWE